MGNDFRCKAGRATIDPRCDFHPQHYWCRRCQGFYGVPHGDDGCHSPNGKRSSGGSPHPECACRWCRINFAAAPSGDEHPAEEEP